MFLVLLKDQGQREHLDAKKTNSKYMNINKCALFEIKSYIQVPAELYCSMKGLLSSLNDNIDVLGSV